MKEEKLWKLTEIQKQIIEQDNGPSTHFIKTCEEGIAFSESSILAIRNFKERSSQVEFTILDDFLNFFLFIHTFQLDITTVLYRYFMSKISYELIYFGKNCALLVFEYLNSINPAFEKLSKNPPGLLELDIKLFKIAQKDFSKIKKSNTQMKLVRDMIAAHRSHDSFEYLKISTEMDSHHYIGLAGEVVKVNTSLLKIVDSSLKKIDVVFKNHLPKRDIS